MEKMDLNYGFIGLGNMGRAVCKQLIIKKGLRAQQIYFNRRNPSKIEKDQKELQIKFLELQDLIEKCNIIIFCVEPQNLEAVLKLFPKKDYSGKFFITIIAKKSFSFYQEFLGENIQLMRTMPNMLVADSLGMTALSFTNHIEEKNKELGKSLFALLGEIIIVEESQILATVGLSGCSPALFAHIADVIAKEGEKRGLDYSESLKLVAQTMLGVGHVLFDGTTTSEKLIKSISVPGGSTQRGMKVYKELSIDNDLEQVIQGFAPKP